MKKHNTQKTLYSNGDEAPKTIQRDQICRSEQFKKKKTKTEAEAEVEKNKLQKLYRDTEFADQSNSKNSKTEAEAEFKKF